MDLFTARRRFDWSQYPAGLALGLSGFLILGSVPAWANEVPRLESAKEEAEQSVFTVAEWIAQTNPSPTTITNVRVEETEAGLQVVLETTDGTLGEPASSITGDALILEIPNAMLEGEEVEQFSPAEDIALVQVSSQEGDRVQVVITGTATVPNVTVGRDRSGLVLSVMPGIAQADDDNDAIQILVTGEDEGYSPSSAGTATRTDTPLRDVPQSIQVIPQQVIEDQGITRIGDALRNVSGVTRQRDRSNASDRFTIRGFDQSRLLRNGFRTGSSLGGTLATATNTVERIEVLKGPASVLYGQVEPGGVINFVTKQPQSEPFYDLAFTAGSFSYLEPSLDFTGPLTTDRKLTYRLNASYQNSDSFRDFIESEQVVVAPTLRYEFSDATSLTFEYSYLDSSQTYDEGLPIDPISFDLPRERTLSEPDDSYDNTNHSFYLTLDHRFNENIRLRSSFGAELSNIDETGFRLIFNGFDPETGENTRQYVERDFDADNLSWQTDLIAEFNTGSIEHQLLAGFELARVEIAESRADFFDSDITLPINVRNPQYGTPAPSDDERNVVGEFNQSTNIFGFYLQNQITLLPNLKLLVGGRYDFAKNENGFDLSFNDDVFSESNEVDSEAFSPRAGIVYQPSEQISLYASYSRSFIPNSDTTVDGDVMGASHLCTEWCRKLKSAIEIGTA
ncbi:MAG: TonB-dependent siderophore receptor [Cyanophyceae cyanobacterium]